MRRLFLLIVLLAFATNKCMAQINHVGFGGGTMQFPSIEIPEGNKFGYDAQTADPTQGGGGYLELGFDAMSGDRGAGGVGILIAGDSQITYGGNDYGSGAVGLYGFTQIRIVGSFRFIAKAGMVGIHTYEKRGNTLAKYGMMDPQANLPELKSTNIQPWGQVGLGIGGVEVVYAPASNSIMVGFRLFKG